MGFSPIPKSFLVHQKELIKKEKFAEAEKSLDQIIHSETNSKAEKAYSYYLIGYININLSNRNRNQMLAKRSFLANIKSDYPIPESFIHYAELENDNNIATNYLKLGLDKFPDNSSIYIDLLKYSDKKDKFKYIKDIGVKDLGSLELLDKVIEFLISQGHWEEAEFFLKRQLEREEVPEFYRLYYKVLYSFSMLIQNKNIKKAKGIFLETIKKDISNRLKYTQYMGEIWCCIIMGLPEDAVRCFDKIPVAKGLEDLDAWPWNIIVVDFSSIYKKIFMELSTLVKEDKKRTSKLAAMEACYLYSPSEIFDVFRYNKKHLKALKRYYKTDVKNLNVACAIYNMQIHYKLYFEAYKTYINMLCEYLCPEDNDIHGINFLEECSSTEIEQIYNDLKDTLNSNIDIDLEKIVTDIFDKIIDYLYSSDEENRFEKICNLSSLLSKSNLKKSDKLFEIARSYTSLDEKTKIAEELYLLVLEKEPYSSNTWNNLGVIYHKRKDLKKAEECFQKALEINAEDEMHSSNLQIIRKEIKENEKVINELKTENAWFLGRLAKLCEVANDSGEFICTYKNRPNILAVSPKKADELFDTMKKSGYIMKIRNDEGPSSKYSINSYVIKYLAEEKNRIKENKIYEDITEKVNIDEINKIGYTNDIKDLLNNVSDSELRDILKRDIRECAINFLTNQHKSCIVICGSIIESILVDKLESMGIHKYDIGLLSYKKSENKSVDEMNLNELLEIAKHEKLLKVEEYHLSSYVRSYRNIIHPSCEIRKNYDVDEHTARLMWYALLKIIKEVLK